MRRVVAVVRPPPRMTYWGSPDHYGGHGDHAGPGREAFTAGDRNDCGRKLQAWLEQIAESAAFGGAGRVRRAFLHTLELAPQALRRAAPALTLRLAHPSAVAVAAAPARSASSSREALRRGELRLAIVRMALPGPCRALDDATHPS